MSEGEFKLDFLGSMRSTPMGRHIFFEYLCRKDEGRRFGDGQAGLQLYRTLLQCVRKVGPEEAVKEYHDFFLPRLDQELLKNEVKEAQSPVSPFMHPAQTLDTVERAKLQRSPKQKRPWWTRILG